VFGRLGKEGGEDVGAHCAAGLGGVSSVGHGSGGSLTPTMAMLRESDIVIGLEMFWRRLV
jgi:hypothetical protein